MKHRFISLLIGSILLFVLGCTNTLTKQDTIIDSSQPHLIKQCKLSDIISQVQFIPLETNDSVLVGNISKIKQRNGNFYILADGLLLKFSPDGKFERNMVGIGGGPLEVPAIADYDVYKDKLYILSPGKILEIDNSNYRDIRVIPVPQHVGWGRIRTTDYGILIAANNPNDGNSAIMLLDYDDGSIVKELVRGDSNWELQRAMELLPIDSKHYMHQLGQSDDVLLLNVDAATVDTIRFSGFDNVISNEGYKKESRTVNSKTDFDTEAFYGICNSNSHYFWAGLNKSGMRFYFSDKATGQTISVPSDGLIDNVTFTEDINQNQLIGMLSFNDSDGDSFISVIYPEDIKGRVSDAPAKFRNEYAIIDSLEADSNPLVVLIKFDSIRK